MIDLRFGLTEGFNNGAGEFVFTYLIEKKEGKVLVEQKKQSFKGIDKAMVKLWDRMMGRKS